MLKKVTLLSLCVIFICLILVGCSTKKESHTSNDAKLKLEKSTSDSQGLSEPLNDFSDTKSKSSKVDENKSINNVNNNILSQRKIIRNADISIEVENFQSSYQKIKTIIAPYGYVQNSNISNEEYYSFSKKKYLTKGLIVIRIDQNKFDDILDKIGIIGTKTNENITSEDVTDKFYDVESRLRLLKLEQSKLEDYLKTINDPDTIFKIEDKLTQIRQEIESLTGNLNKLNDLVQLSTIQINITEKRSDEKIKSKSYFTKLLNDFLNSTNGLINFIGIIIKVIVIVLPFAVFFGLIIFLILKIIKFYKKRSIKSNSINIKKDN